MDCGEGGGRGGVGADEPQPADPAPTGSPEEPLSFITEGTGGYGPGTAGGWEGGSYSPAGGRGNRGGAGAGGASGGSARACAAPPPGENPLAMTAPPRFFLAEPPGARPPRLEEAESLHALRVLRLAPGDACIGLDGRGRAWPLRVVAATRRELGLEVTGPVEFEPEPGGLGAPLPFIEVAEIGRASCRERGRGGGVGRGER